ncbi:hypothetical protein I302_101100 [Kwoniella bestiolae CBS 10118]|uniref:Uncharacterized protein n=1 Tax=Kwoniella bestiolae CBS 10118 TaxID=1296100 RepID=A0A1B9G6Z2_9TREE|nr:hypothetical protein I302_04475 [Kwoniella bestiolae CBS 10118]OCF26786.1 hypothetical protein I302_04475 [Kwoniella bestiolae CBS 10118]
MFTEKTSLGSPSGRPKTFDELTETERRQLLPAVFSVLNKRKPLLARSRLNDWYNKADYFSAPELLFDLAVRAYYTMPGVKFMPTEAASQTGDQLSIWFCRLLYLNEFSAEFSPHERTMMLNDLKLASAVIGTTLFQFGAYKKDAYEVKPTFQDLIDGSVDVCLKGLGISAGIDVEDHLRRAVTPFPTRGYRERSAIGASGEFVDTPMSGKGELPEPISTENKRTRFLPCQTPSVRSATARGSA